MMTADKDNTFGRRRFLSCLALGAATFLLTARTGLAAVVQKLNLSEEEWRRRLTPEQFRVLREKGTEPPHTSPLAKEKRSGTYHCAGCELPLFTSEMKFDSGTGWPSFYDVLPGHVETKTDFKLFLPRTEYHCARCGGHHGHVFKDGPKPTGLRYCNNGVALYFRPTGGSP
jgi:peptide-methionine (R)-S-oxide reductase